MKYNRITIVLFNIITSLFIFLVAAPYTQKEFDLKKNYGSICIGLIFIGIISYSLIQLYRKRKCKRCKTAMMKRKFNNEENEYIFVCPNCKSEQRSGVFIGGD